MEWLIKLLIDMSVENGINYVFTLRYKTKYRRKIQNEVKRITNDFMKRYGDREYYNSLDCYYTNNKVIKRLIESCVNLFSSKKNYIELIQDIVNIFLENYNQYDKYRSEIEIGMKGMFDDAFNCLNQLSGSDNLKVANIIKKNMDDNTYEIKNEIKKYSNVMLDAICKEKEININDYSMVLISQNNMKYIGGERPFLGSKIASRKHLVDYLIDLLKTNVWIHVYGEIWSGKTHLLYLLSERLLDYKWINIDALGESNIVNGFKILMQSSANIDSNNTQDILNNFMSTMPRNSVLIVDGIQGDHINSTEFLLFLGALYSSCINHGIKIITSGYCELKTQTGLYVDEESIYSMNIPSLTTEDIEELFDYYKVPNNLNRKNKSKILGDFYGKIPGLVMEVIWDLKDNKWNNVDKFWDRMFNSDIGSLENILEQQLVSKLSESERILLYRISYVGHDISDTLVLNLAQINPKINDFEKNRLHLYSRWIQKDNNIIKVNKLYKTIAGKNLSDNEKESIHNVIVEYYKHSKYINQIDFINFISHLIQLKKFDDVGSLYIKILTYMIEENVIEDQFAISKFWCELPLPAKMSDDLKVLVRMQQVRYLSFVKKDVMWALKDMVKLVSETQTGGEFILIQMAMSKMDFDVVSLCMDTALKNNLWGDCRNKLMKILEGAINFTDKCTDVFDLSIMVYALSVKNINQFEVFIEHIKKCSSIEIDRVIEQNHDLFLNIFDTVRHNTDDYTRYEKKLSEILDWANINKLELLVAIIYVARMRLQSENFDNYNAAMELYNKALKKVITKRCKHIIIDGIAKINIENMNIENNLNLITDAYESMNLDIDNIISNIFTCLNYMEYIPNKNNKLAAAEKLLMIGKSLSKEQEDEELFYRIKGEYFINAYLCGDMKKCLDEFYNYIMELINSTNSSKKYILICLLHIVGYIVPDIVYQRPPQKVENGEVYFRPYRKMLININDTEQLEELYTDIKVNYILLLTSELAYYYDDQQVANKIIIELVRDNKIFFEESSTIFIQNSFLSYLLIQNQLFNEYFELLNDYNEKIKVSETDIMRLIINIALFVANDSKIKGQVVVIDGLIDALYNYEGEVMAQKYFREFSQILSVFQKENGDYNLLSWCGDKLKNTDKSNLSNVINILMIVKIPKEKNKNFIDAVSKLLDMYKLSNDMYTMRKIEIFK